MEEQILSTPQGTVIDEASSPKESKTRKKRLITRNEVEDAKKEFASMFDRLMYGYSVSEVFVDFLDYVLLVFRWWENDRDFSYWENRYKRSDAGFLRMVDLLSIITEGDGEGCHDALGDLFMELVSHGRNGQFFTPEPICDFMSLASGADALKDGQNVLDPTCGSGRMLLSAAKKNRNIRLFGCDNDITCCKMAVINLLLNSLKGEIALMDSLRMEYHRSWSVGYRNVGGVNLPVYYTVENKEESLLWKLHLNSFGKQDDAEPAEPVRAEPVVSEFTEKAVTIRRKKPAKTEDCQLKLF